MAEEKLGIKETKDALEALNKISLLLIKHLKDGAQLKDALEMATEVMAGAELKTAVAEAFKGITAIPSELKDLDSGEIFELVMNEGKFGLEVIGALKA